MRKSLLLLLISLLPIALWAQDSVSVTGNGVTFVDGIRQMPEPVTTAFERKDFVGYYYLYNTSAKGYFTQGNTWGTRACVGPASSAVQVYFEVSDSAPEGAYLLHDLVGVRSTYTDWHTVCATTGNNTIYTDQTESWGRPYWYVIPMGSTFRMQTTQSELATDSTMVLYMGRDDSVPQEFNQAYSGFTDDDKRFPLSAEIDEGAGHHIDWVLVSEEDYNILMERMAVYDKAEELRTAIAEAKEKGTNVSAEEAVYLNAAATLDELTNALYAVWEKESQVGTSSLPAPIISRLGASDSIVITKQAFASGTDFTKLVNTDPNSWTASAYCAVQYAPAVTTSDGREAQMVERYFGNSYNTGTYFEQTISSLANGVYTVILAANACYTPGRGITETAEEGATDVVYVFANDERMYIPLLYTTQVTANGEYVIQTKVYDGTLRLGMVSEREGANWFTIQIKQLTKVDGGQVATLDNISVYYTTDGSEPSRDNGMRYTEPFLLDGNGTVKAVETCDGFDNSEVTTFTADWFVVDEVKFALEGDRLAMSTATPGATIHYTVNEPSVSSASTVYTTPIALPDICVVRAFAERDRYTSSAMTSFAYMRTSSSLPMPRISRVGDTDNIQIAVTAGTGAQGNTDLTAYVETDYSAWGGNGYASTQVAPTVITADGREAQMAEHYVENATGTGIVLEQTVAGLENGTYRVTLAANACVAWTTSSASAGDMNVAYVFANDIRQSLPVRLETAFSENGFYELTTVVTDGTLRLGIGKERAGTNWHTIQILELVKLGGTANVSTDSLTIYYTTDGSVPSRANGIRYVEPFTVERNCVVSAVSVSDGYDDSSVASMTVDWFYVQPVTFALYNIRTLTMATETPGATIHYTINDAALSINSPVYNSEYIELPDSAVVRAFAVRDGYTDSEVTSYTFVNTIATKLDAPTISRINKTDSVRIAMRDLEVKKDYTAYVGYSPSSWAVNAQACNAEYAPYANVSGVGSVPMAEIYYENTERVGTQMQQTVNYLENGTYKVTLAANTYYTNGRGFLSDVHEGDMDVVYLFANDAVKYIPAHIGTVVKENGIYELTTTVTDGTMVIGLTQEKVGTNWHTLQIVELAKINVGGTAVNASDVKIYYTRNNTVPTAATGTLYTEPFRVQGNCTVRAIATCPGYPDSDEAVLKVDWFKVANVSIVQHGKYIQMYTATPNATIYYAIDDEELSKSSHIYSGQIEMARSCQVRAYAVLDGYEDSPVSVFNFDLSKLPVLLKPEISRISYSDSIQIVPGGLRGDLDRTSRVGMTAEAWNGTGLCDTKFAPAVLTTVGTTAQMAEHYEDETTVVGVLMEQTVTNLRNGTYRVTLAANACFAHHNNNTSSIAEGATDAVYLFANNIRRPVPVQTATEVESNGMYTMLVEVTDGTLRMGLEKVKEGTNWHTLQIVSLVQQDAVWDEEYDLSSIKVYYTTDGSNPTTSNGRLYATPFVVSKNCTIQAVSTLSGFDNSEVASFNVDWLQLPNLEYTLNADSTKLSISCSVEGVTIYYTDDTTEPSETNGLRYVEPITLDKNMVIRAIGVKSGYVSSSIRSFRVNWFKVKNPEFTVNSDNRLEITCATPGASIYYYIGETPTPDVVNRLYTMPIALTNNMIVTALATREGYTNSDMVRYETGMGMLDSVRIAYSGRFVKMTCEEGVQIRYTTDGTVPTDNSTLYVDSFEPEHLCLIKAIATREGYLNSVMTSRIINYFYDGRFARVSQGGLLANAFAWCGTDAVRELSVEGPLNETDLTLVKSLPNLHEFSLEKSGMTELPENALDGAGFVVFRSPNLQRVRSGVLANCPNLAAVFWNSTQVSMPTDGISNTNMLVYVKSAALKPSGLSNIVVNGEAERVVLTDAGNFFCPEAFTAKQISYTHDYQLATDPGTAQGWESLVLPFTPTSISHATAGNVAPFLSGREGVKNFWLMGMEEDGNGLVKRAAIEANKPYIVSMPNSRKYSEEFNIPGAVTFAAENVTVPVTDLKGVEYEGVTLVPTFLALPQSAGVYTLNTAEYDGRPAGSIFVENQRAVRPFEAYTLHRDGVRGYIDLSELTGDNVTAIQTVYSSMVADGRYYDMSGRMVAHGEEAAKKLPKGVYVVNGKKVIVNK